MKPTNITAIIPARSGSRRIKHKNIVQLNGSPLLARKVRQCVAAGFDEIVVSSDSEEYLRVAYDAVPHGSGVRRHLRNQHLCDEDACSFNDVVAELAGLARTEWVAWTPCTCPFHDEVTFDGCINQTLDLDDEYDSVVSVVPMLRYMMDAHGDPINYEPEAHTPSQGLPSLYRWSGGYWAARREDMIAWRYFHGPNPKLFTVTEIEGIDIDTQDDLDIARALEES